jgi:hypothetical protein
MKKNVLGFLLILSVSMSCWLSFSIADEQVPISKNLSCYSEFLRTLDGEKLHSILKAKNEYLKLFTSDPEHAEEGFRLFLDFSKAVPLGFEFDGKFYTVLEKVVEVLLKHARDQLRSDINFKAFDAIKTRDAAMLRYKYKDELKKLEDAYYAGFGFYYGGEGEWEVTRRDDFLLEILKSFNFEYKQYLELEEKQKSNSPFGGEGSVSGSWDQIREYIAREEEFIQQHGQMPEVQTYLLPRLERDMRFYLLGEDNAAIWDEKTRKLKAEILGSYKRFLGENFNSRYYSLVKDVYTIYGNYDGYINNQCLERIESEGQGFKVYRSLRGLAAQNTPRFLKFPLNTEADFIKLLSSPDTNVQMFAVEELNGRFHAGFQMSEKFQLALIDFFTRTVGNKIHENIETYTHDQHWEMKKLIAHLERPEIFPFLIDNFEVDLLWDAILGSGEPALIKLFEKTKDIETLSDDQKEALARFFVRLAIKNSDLFTLNKNLIEAKIVEIYKSLKLSSLNQGEIEYERLAILEALLQYIAFSKSSMFISVLNELSNLAEPPQMVYELVLPFEIQKIHGERCDFKGANDAIAIARETKSKKVAFFPIHEKAQWLLKKIKCGEN